MDMVKEDHKSSPIEMHIKVAVCKDCDHTDDVLKKSSINLNIAIDFSLQENKKFNT